MIVYLFTQHPPRPPHNFFIDDRCGTRRREGGKDFEGRCRKEVNTSLSRKSQREPGVGLALFLLSFVVLPVALESALSTLLRLAKGEEVDEALRMRKEERESGKRTTRVLMQSRDGC
jgi:hypothetical protein